MTLEKLLTVGRSLELSKQQAEDIERALSVDTSFSMVQRRHGSEEMNNVIDVGGISTSKQFPSEGKPCQKCGKIGHFVKLCKSTKPP